MPRDFETLYYEQQANFTESNGIIWQERERFRERVEAQEAELIALRLKLASKERHVEEYEYECAKIIKTLKNLEG